MYVYTYTYINTYLYTEYDGVGLTLKGLTINTSKHSQKR